MTIYHSRDIVVHAHSRKLHRIQHYFSCYDSLQYSLLLSNGKVSWHQDIERNTIRSNDNDDINNLIIEETSNFLQINSIEDIMNNENRV